MNKIVISGVDKRKILDLGKEILLRDKDYQFQNISAVYFEKDNLIEVFIPFNRSNMRVFLNNVFQKFIISIENGNGQIEEELFVFPNKQVFLKSRFHIQEHLELIRSGSGYNIVSPLVNFISFTYMVNYNGREGFYFIFSLKSLREMEVKYPNYKYRIRNGLEGFKNRSVDIIWMLLSLTAFLNYYSVIITRDTSFVINEEYLESVAEVVKKKKANSEIILDFKKVFSVEEPHKLQSDKHIQSCDYQYDVRGHLRHNRNGTTSWVRPYTKNKDKERKDRNYKIKLD